MWPTHSKLNEEYEKKHNRRLRNYLAGMAILFVFTVGCGVGIPALIAFLLLVGLVK